VFALFHPHGPVFRAMLRVEKLRGAWAGEHIGFLGQCARCGGGRAVGAQELGAAACGACGAGKVGGSNPGAGAAALAVSGPLWTGPLHDRAAVRRLRAKAQHMGWLASAGGEGGGESHGGSRVESSGERGSSGSGSGRGGERRAKGQLGLGELLVGPGGYNACHVIIHMCRPSPRFLSQLVAS
jgi:hypothetical protein